MSKYTTEVRYICEQAAGLVESKGFDNVDDIIDAALPGVFSFDFPVFDENYRSVICTKILRHYYTREIGQETVGLWKLKLQTKLNEVMPYFNQLYESELIKFNPLYDVDTQTTHVGNRDSENTKDENRTGVSSTSSDRSETENRDTITDNVEGVNTSGTNKSDDTRTNVANNNNNKTQSNTNYDLYSDTPQGALDGVEDEEYLTNARKITNEGSENSKADSTNVTQGNIRNEFSENTARTAAANEHIDNTRSANGTDIRNDIGSSHGVDKFNSTESYVLHVVGKQSGTSYSKMLQEFRETFLNIDLEVIESLADLFMMLW